MEHQGFPPILRVYIIISPRQRELLGTWSSVVDVVFDKNASGNCNFRGICHGINRIRTGFHHPFRGIIENFRGDEISRTVINCKKNLNISISKFVNSINVKYGNFGCSRIREFFVND